MFGGLSSNWNFRKQLTPGVCGLCMLAYMKENVLYNKHWLLYMPVMCLVLFIRPSSCVQSDKRMCVCCSSSVSIIQLSVQPLVSSWHPHSWVPISHSLSSSQIGLSQLHFVFNTSIYAFSDPPFRFKQPARPPNIQSETRTRKMAVSSYNLFSANKDWDVCWQNCNANSVFGFLFFFCFTLGLQQLGWAKQFQPPYWF